MVHVVAPLVGAWIEIKTVNETLDMLEVAPLVGAWIEIVRRLSKIRPAQSLLSWERGLKYASKLVWDKVQSMSLLSWERGLKLLLRK